MPLDPKWGSFCQRGRYSTENQIRSVDSCKGPDGVVRGYYSDLELDPTLPERSALYPSHDHRKDRGDDGDMVVDARMFNDMKTVLAEEEFWKVIEHLYRVGKEKGKIGPGEPRRLPREWSPKRGY